MKILWTALRILNKKVLSKGTKNLVMGQISFLVDFGLFYSAGCKSGKVSSQKRLIILGVNQGNILLGQRVFSAFYTLIICYWISVLFFQSQIGALIVLVLILVHSSVPNLYRNCGGNLANIPKPRASNFVHCVKIRID